MSDTLLVDSTSPTDWPWVRSVPTAGSVTKTMSPRASWAYDVMPTRRTVPSPSPTWRTHSCSAVYCRSSGYTDGLSVGSVSDGGLPDLSTVRGRRSILRLLERSQGAHRDPVGLLDLGPA